MTYREYYFNQIKNKADFSKVHVYSNLPQELCCRLMQVSTLHAYYTYPFFSSLTILEAMSTGCVVIGSKTGPVEEFITDGMTGYLFDFFNIKQFAEKAVRIIHQDPDQRYRVGMRAREFIKACLDWETRVQPFWERFLKLK
jgi:glycosyltransferase involved in cell wall biosynthesis